jgi:hypothetical protein
MSLAVVIPQHSIDKAAGVCIRTLRGNCKRITLPRHHTHLQTNVASLEFSLGHERQK